MFRDNNLTRIVSNFSNSKKYPYLLPSHKFEYKIRNTRRRIGRSSDEANNQEKSINPERIVNRFDLYQQQVSPLTLHLPSSPPVNTA